VNKTRIMTACYASLIGIVALLVLAPLAVAEDNGFDRAFPSWDKQINKPSRFKVLSQFGNAAVLDKETGLVWEQSPETAPNPTTGQTWLSAQSSCNTRTVGGRLGWRLPTLQELASLVDPNNPGGDPDLPPGHPFSNVQSSHYWSATTLAGDSASAWDVNFNFGIVTAPAKTSTIHVWCVRGGQGVDLQ
jgi:hypothetical protein